MSDSSELNLDGDFLFAPQMGEDTSSQSLGQFLLDDSPAVPGVNKANGTLQFDEPVISARYDANQLRSESVQQRVAKVTASATPLQEAARPLLRALSEMPETVKDREQVTLLKQGLKNEITLFGVVCDEADISWKKMAIVRYCLCTALDESAHARPWGMDAAWSQSNLLNHFEGDNDGGNKFFLLVGRLSMTPHEYADVLDILLCILGLGFEGRYSIIENGERQLTKIRQRLLTLLQSTRDSIPAALSPHGIPERGEKKRQWIFVPVRVSLLFACCLAAGSFIACKYLLMVPESGLLAQMQSLAKVPTQQVERLRLAILLRPEIEKNLVSVDETAGRSQVTFRGDAMFAVGKTDVQPEMMPILKRVAEEIMRVKGQVRIVGYTDSTPIYKPGLPNNKVLSEKRAASIALLLQQQGMIAGNVKYEGRGDRDPVADNQTAAGRAKNRRVDIFVNY